MYCSQIEKTQVVIEGCVMSFHIFFSSASGWAPSREICLQTFSQISINIGQSAQGGMAMLFVQAIDGNDILQWIAVYGVTLCVVCETLQVLTAVRESQQISDCDWLKFYLFSVPL